MMFQVEVDNETVELEYYIENNDYSLLLGDVDGNLFYFHNLKIEQMKDLYESLDKFFGGQ